MVVIWRDVSIRVNGETIEAYGCEIDGSDNIVTGDGNRIRGHRNVIFGLQKSVEGKDNTLVMDGDETKTKKKRKKPEKEELADTKSKIQKHLDSLPGDFGPGGLLLIPKKREDEVKDGSVELLYCKLCRDKIVRVLCEPCYHLCVCISCSRSIGALNKEPQCPLCKKKIVRFREVFLV